MTSKVPNQNHKIVFAGGGTAGHIMPGLAVADALLDLGYTKNDILFMGSQKGMEKSLVEKAGFETVLYNTKGLLRRISFANIDAMTKFLFHNGKSFISAYSYLKKHRPKVLVMLGGYAGFIPSFAAVCLQIPTVVVNVDTAPGLSNRIIGRFAKVNTLPFASQKIKRSLVIGTPIAKRVSDLTNFLLSGDEGGRISHLREFASDGFLNKLPLGVANDITKESSLENTDLEFLVLSIMSGSLGAYNINKNIPDLVLKLGMDDKLKCFAGRILVYHVVGERDFEEIKSHCFSLRESNVDIAQSDDSSARFVLLRDEGKKVVFRLEKKGSTLEESESLFYSEYCVVSYEDKVPELLSVTDLFIGRAGASTVAELVTVGVPSLLIPLPNAPRDHQRENIKALLREKAVCSIDDDRLDQNVLYQIVTDLLLDKERRKQMALSINKFAKKDAAATVAGLLRLIDAG